MLAENVSSPVPSSVSRPGCVAVGGDSAGSSAVIEGTKVTRVALPPTVGKGMLGLACDTATRCTATDGVGHFVSLSIPAKAWGRAKLFPKAIPVSALACPLNDVCVGLGDSGLALRTTSCPRRAATGTGAHWGR